MTSKPIDVRKRNLYSTDQFYFPKGYEGIKGVLISKGELNSRIRRISEELMDDYKDKNPIFLGIMTGVIHFFSSLVLDTENLNFPFEYHFVKAKSYEGETRKSLKLQSIDLETLRDKDVVVVEDIVDSGYTLAGIKEYLGDIPKSIEFCVMLDKKDKRIVQGINPKYIGFIIPDYFVIGYGLDYNDKYRNFPHIAVLEEYVYSGE